MSAPGPGQGLSIDQLAALREKTEAVSDWLRERLAGHLQTLQVALSPRWLLGKHTRAGAKDDIPGADRAAAEVRERYGQYYGAPLLLPKEMPEGPVSIDGRLDLYPWEYTQTLGGEEGREITMTTPDRWVVNYRSGYSLAQLRKAVSARRGLRPEDAQQFVINAITLGLVFERNPGFRQILTDLRYEVRFEPADGLGKLPLVSIASCLPSFKPQDDLILSATRFSGVPAFIELIDLDATGRLEDPLCSKISEITR